MSITIRQKLIEKYKKFPLTPGVYLFTNKSEVLYVGKATKLRQRVSQYFNLSSSTGRDIRMQEMISLAKDIKFYETDSVLEALILEANLIKKYWPKYNVKDKDDRSFIYIVISKKDDFPKPQIIRGHELSKFQIQSASRRTSFHLFGPYQSLTIVNNALKIIRRIFPYSTCQSLNTNVSKKSSLPPFKKGVWGIIRKPCFNYQIGLCPGACIGAISKQDYKKNIKNIVLLLSGKRKLLLKKLQKENPEKARALQHIQDVSLIQRDSDIENYKLIRQLADENSTQRIEGYDISHLSGKETYGSMVVFTNNQPDKNEYRLFKIKHAPANDDLHALEEMITRRFNHPEWQRPDLIMIDGGTPQISHIQKTLDNLNINIPIVGISKYSGDELVFPLKAGKLERENSKNIKEILLRVRDEAHRFALKNSRKNRKSTFIKSQKI